MGTAMNRRPSLEAVVSFAVVAASALLVFFSLHPSKLFLNTTPAGGDMGAHVWAPQYLRDHLFTHGRISGWAPDWYDGFPALTFYFPLPYVIIALLSYVLPYGVAFKLISVSGLVGLPVAAWAFGRLLRMRFPGPPLLALATVPFLFDRYFTITGGNIASTLAGEFAFSISLALALLFLGVFSRCLETGRHRALAAVLLAATGLSHLLPTLFVALSGGLILFLLHRPNRRRLVLGLTVGVLAGCLAAFWIVPFAFRLGYSNDMGWERTTEYLKGLFPFLQKGSVTPTVYTRHLKLVVALAAAGSVGGIALRRRATVLITGMGLVAAAAFRLMQQGLLWNDRVLPFWYLMLYLAAAAGVAEAANALGVLFGHRPRQAPEELEAMHEGPVRADERELVLAGVGGGGSASAGWAGYEGGLDASGGPDGPPPGDGASVPFPEDDGEIIPTRVPALLAPLVIAVLIWLFVGQTIGIVPPWWPSFGRVATAGDHNFVVDWANWNYSGYERKSAYPEYRDIIDTMAHVGATNGCGRAMWEYESSEDRFGTPMALMLLPKWTNGCIDSMEGLFFESSATVPYHFLNQSELSNAGSDAMRDLPYSGLNVADGIAHLRMLGVRYYMAISPQAQAQARAVPGIHLVATTSKPYDVTEDVDGTQKSVPRLWEVYQIDNSDPVSGMPYQPVVMTGVPTKGKGWIAINAPKPKNGVQPLGWYTDPRRWDVPLAASGPPQWARVHGADPNPPRIPVRQAVVTNIRMTDDRISFDVDQPGTPVEVKTSYFPNWQATGAQGPWRVTPNLMVVIPTSTHVELHYGFTPVDNAGRLLTAGGLMAAGLLAWSEHGRVTDVLAPVGDDETPARDRPMGRGEDGGGRGAGPPVGGEGGDGVEEVEDFGPPSGWRQ